MKRFSLPLIAIALVLLVGACSSPSLAKFSSPKSTGTRATAWGNLPTYDTTGQRFTLARPARLPHGAFSDKTATLDVVVNADGSVEDATVTVSSGDPVVDRAALVALIGARYSLQVGPSQPAPFVVQQKMTFSRELAERSSYTQPYGPVGRQDSMPQSGAPYYQTWNGANGGLSGGGGSSSSSSSSSN